MRRPQTTELLLLLWVELILEPDQQPHMGPLYALHNIFLKTKLEQFLLVPCDMPCLPKPVLDLLWAKSTLAPITVLADKGDRLQPFPGIYRREAIPALAQAIDLGRRDMKALFKCPGLAHVIEWTEWAPHDPSARMLVNINTPQDYAAFSSQSLQY